MARSVKQTAKAPLSAHPGSTGVRTIRAAAATGKPDTRLGSASGGDKPSSWPIYEELVAELGDPTA